jgi:CDP-paratose 2-epimerase
VDWVIDAAANPSVLAGVDGRSSSRQLIEHNLSGTVNMLEFCRARGAGFILLSTSRVYSIPPLCALPLRTEGARFVLDDSKPPPPGVSAHGVDETFSTAPPLSLYGVSKKMSEDLALEYASTFKLPVWINRCGVMAGAGQFGRADQGIVAFWIHSWREGRPLRYLGFGGHGHQVRDVLHPDDLAALLVKQMRAGSGRPEVPRVLNVCGGGGSSFSLAELTAWCADRFGKKIGVVQDGSERPFDIAWLILDDARARSAWDWKPVTGREAVFEEVARFAEAEPEWMQVSQ